MSFAPVYLLNRALFRLSDFFRHWYLDGTRSFAHNFLRSLSGLDHTFALRITMHNFNRPLYGDYSPVGRVLGFVFRTFRIGIAVVLYLVWAVIYLGAYIVWLVVPFIPLYLAYRDIFLS